MCAVFVLRVWLSGQIYGAFLAFIPIEVMSFLATYAIVDGHPTPTTSIYACCAGAIVTVLPGLIRIERIAKQDRSRDAAGDAGSNAWAGEWIAARDRSGSPPRGGA